MSAPPCNLNAQDCSLGLQLLQLPEGGEIATPPAHGACGFAWHGARGTIGTCGGRHRFSVRLLQHVQPEPAVVQQHADFHELSAVPGVRVGVSSVSTDIAMLGESMTSWAFASTGRKSGGGGGFLPYGHPFGNGDEVHVCVELTGEVATVSFAVNDHWFGEAFRLPRPGPELRVFPHILVKNTAVRVAFGSGGPLEGPASTFRPWQFAGNVPQHFCLSPTLATNRDRYEVLVLLGMPGSGKSQWAEQYMRGHHGYTLLSVNAALDQMRVRGMCRQREHAASMGPLLQLGEQLFEAQLNWATHNPRNYLIDQPSVHEEGVCSRVAGCPRPAFRRVAALIVLPDTELFRRQAAQHAAEGKTVPEEVILGMRDRTRPSGCPRNVHTILDRV